MRPENKCQSCYKHRCANNSTCVNQGDDYKCECAVGYYGQLCERSIDACFGQPCMNGGTCQVLSDGTGGRYKCDCEPGWEGFSCEININDCRSSPCANNGTCVDKLAGYECNCSLGFTGKN